MEFINIDLQSWNRKEYFEHYFSKVPCTYSMTVKLDITAIKKTNRKVYPSMLYALTTVVNQHEEFRMDIDQNGRLGFYSEMIPSYTVWNQETQLFTNLWTAYHSDIEKFCKAYEMDIAQYAKRQGLTAKPNVPKNTFPISMVPWTTFEGFHLHLQKGYEYLLPIFTMGKYFQEQEKVWMPLAIQVHHAVCDGFHVGRFLEELQALINEKW